ncbi:hypothetical protein T10_670, partial [Trichinella papuae]
LNNSNKKFPIYFAAAKWQIRLKSTSDKNMKAVIICLAALFALVEM